MSGTVNIPVTVQALQGVAIPSATPADGDALVYSATTSAWTHKPAGGSVVNYVDNSGFTVNQRGYTSGSALAAGAYGFDRWKAGDSGCTITFTAITGASNTVTIAAGSILQVIDGAGLVTGTYTLSWAGTAQGRIGNGNGGLSSAYAASPLEWSATAGTNVTIEFTNGTLGQVQMQLGSTATPWQPLPPAVELARCERYCTQITIGESQYGSGGVSLLPAFQLPTTMRTTPTCTIMQTAATENCTVVGATGFSPNEIFVTAVVAATGIFGIGTQVVTATADL